MYHYEVISDEYKFEEFIKDLFNAQYSTQSFQLYGVKGATQHGIDVFSTEKRIVIQCKKKDLSKTDYMLKKDLLQDFEKSLQLVENVPFDFETFILATTTKKYTTIQDEAAKLSQHKPFDIQFLSWKDIERVIDKYIELRHQYYPHLVASESGGPQTKNVSQNVTDSNVYGPVHQVAGDYYNVNKPPDKKILPSPESIGGNPLLKSSIAKRFDKLGEEREKRFGKKAYMTMYGKFKKDFGIKKGKWTQIWEWPEKCAEEIIQYLDEKYNNTKAGRIEKAAKRSNYIHTRPHLFKKERTFLSQLGIDINSNFVKESLKKYFGSSSHKNLTTLQHWQWVCYLENEVEKIYKETEDN